MKTICIFIYISLVVYGEESGENRWRRYFNNVNNVGERVNEYGEAVSDYLDCKKNSEPCRLVPSCCGSLQCYWEHGYNPLAPGVCVTCVDRPLKCQRDSQCCDPFVCQKSSLYDVNGVCDVKRSVGSACHSDSQCSTNYCDISWVNMVKGSGGRCKAL